MSKAEHSLDEQFNFTPAIQKKLLITIGIGVVLFLLGMLIISGDSGHGHEGNHAVQEQADQMLASKDHGASAGHNGKEAAHNESHGGGHGYHWSKRIWANLWINNMFFLGIGLIGVFFLAVQYVAYAGWSAAFKRVMESFGYYLPVAAVFTIIIFAAAQHELFHWTHPGIAEQDKIIAGKMGYLNKPFYWTRMIVYFGAWIVMWWFIRKQSLKEDLEYNHKYYTNMMKLSAGFLVIFAITSSTAAWDWLLSIDTHWFSTMYGWYVFSSWFVAGLAVITLMVISLKENGYLKVVNENHLHDLGKFIFAFSIFWTYIWFSQLLLIYYANIPEESVYFFERFNHSAYWPIFLLTLFLNFLFPFLFMMTRDAKRHIIFLKIACVAVLIGHWLDFYLMVVPGTLKMHGGFGIDGLFVELGGIMIFAGVFLYTVLYGLSKAPLIAKNHPMLQESVHHHL